MTALRRNDPAQYDDLADQWWDASGGFAALHWLAASRAEHIPPAPGPAWVHRHVSGRCQKSGSAAYGVAGPRAYMKSSGTASVGR